jgi:hypothetical protein
MAFEQADSGARQLDLQGLGGVANGEYVLFTTIGWLSSGVIQNLPD